MKKNPSDAISATVAGIDVGGLQKGFHAVILLRAGFLTKASTDPEHIVRWCFEQRVQVIGVDAPCKWSASGKSREAERRLQLGQDKIHCFATPTRAIAQANKKHFYDWVFSGERLYRKLEDHYPRFEGTRRDRLRCCFETFPHGIVCALIGKVVPAKPKVERRRELLVDLGFDVAPLTNIDFIDAALCAVAARKFLQGRCEQFGNTVEGLIVLPKPARLA